MNSSIKQLKQIQLNKFANIQQHLIQLHKSHSTNNQSINNQQINENIGANKYNAKIDRLSPESLDVVKLSEFTSKSLLPKQILKLNLPASQIKVINKPQAKLPKKVDLRNSFPKPQDQGNLGSCTANALCNLYAFNKKIIGSRLFLYYNERVIENNVNLDVGAYIHDGVTSLKTTGVCLETQWPYIINKFNVKPNQACYTSAKKNKISSSKNLPNDLNTLKTALANNRPFAVAIAIYSSFESDSVAKTGYVPMPLPGDALLGGHAVACCGFDDNKQVWIMMNSWGTQWGDKGFFYLPYNYLLNPNLTSDMWYII